jgi:alpha-1,6-mannosyltransferase
MENQKSITAFVLTSGLLMEIFFLAFINFNGSTGNIPLYMFIYFETFLVMLITLFLIKRLDKDEQTEELSEEPKKAGWFLKLFARILYFSQTDVDKLRTPLLVILFGLIFRLTLLPAANTTSHDVNRYLWEGKILSHGYNPFITAPQDTQLIKYRTKLYDDITYKNMATIYPPLAQMTFISAYLLNGESNIGLKLIYLFLDLIIMFLLLKLLYLKKVDLNNIILYAWMPLILMEFFVNVHIDLVAILFMLLFLYFMEKDKIYSAAVFFSLAFLSKIYPVILFPLVLKKAGLKRSIYFFLIFLVIAICSYIPFIYKDYSVFTSLFTYLGKWEFNGSVYLLLKHNYLNPEYSKLVCAGLFILSVGVISILYKDFTKAAYGIFIVLIIFGTTLYPWYLGWITSLNPLYNFYSVTSLLFTINFSNFSPLSTVWKEYLFVHLIEFVPFFALLIIDLFIMWKNRKKKAITRDQVS